jgi:hypothetical protein
MANDEGHRQHGEAGEGVGAARHEARRTPPPGKQTRTSSLPSSPVAPVRDASGPAGFLRSSDARVNGMSVADASHQLRLELNTLAWAVRKVIEGVIGDMEVMAEWRDDNVFDVLRDDASGDDRSQPKGFHGILAELQTLLGRVTFDGTTPDLRALATRVLADTRDFQWMVDRVAVLTTGFADRLGEQQHVLARTLAAVNTTRDLSFAGAVAVAIVVAAPAAAAYGVAGEAGAAVAGGALVGGGLHAADVNDSRPLLDRTLGGLEDGAMMAASGMAGQAAGATISTALRPLVGAAPMGQAITSTLVGAADTAVAAGSYTTGAALGRGDGISAAASEGVEVAIEAAPLGAALGYAAKESAAAAKQPGASPRPRDEVDQRIAAAPPAEQQHLQRVLALDDARGRKLVLEYGDELVEYLHTNPLTTLDDLEKALAKQRTQVTERVRGLYEGIDTVETPDGWLFDDNVRVLSDGTKVVETRLRGPNRADGLFVRAYNPKTKELELRMAFLVMNGEEKALPNMISKQGDAPEMVAGKGTPTVQYVTLHQMRLLGVPAGDASAGAGVRTIHMSDIQNVETIVHLHYLRNTIGGDLSDLVEFTASVKYAETTATQTGYQRAGTPKVSGGQESPIGDILDFQENGNPKRRAANDALLQRYGYDRHTVMHWGFDVDFAVRPIP